MRRRERERVKGRENCAVVQCVLVCTSSRRAAGGGCVTQIQSVYVRVRVDELQVMDDEDSEWSNGGVAGDTLLIGCFCACSLVYMYIDPCGSITVADPSPAVIDLLCDSQPCRDRRQLCTSKSG